MKPLNHKERKNAISKFTFAAIPVILISLMGLFLFFKNGLEHARFIQVKHQIQNAKYLEQAQIGEKIDSILSFANMIINEKMYEEQYMQTQRVISRISEDISSYSIVNEKGAPYNVILAVAKETQTVMDSLHVINGEYQKNIDRLKSCQKINKKSKDEPKR